MLLADLNINTPLRNALEALEYIYATPIQEQAFSVIASGRDVVGIAQTGTGKTLAYLLPILKKLSYSEKMHPRVLIVVPTRELVKQVEAEIERLTQFQNVRFFGVYGGTSMKTQIEKIYQGLDILVATPGRLVDLNLHGALKLSEIKLLVIDEAEEMFNLGFRPQLYNLLDLLPEKKQSLLFSATMNDEVEAILNDFFFNPVKIEIAKTGTPLEQIEQIGYHLPNFNTKINLLVELLKDRDTYQKVLIFVESKKMADRVIDRLANYFPEIIGVIHGNKAQNQRFRAIEKFEDGTFQALVATDIIARGLDIQQVTHVINFDLPELPSTYIHRIGRTGRADQKGQAIALISEFEQMNQTAIEAYMKSLIEVIPLPDNLEVSSQYQDFEKPDLGDKNYYKIHSLKNSGGAFHDKKNPKVNLGSPYKRKAAAKNKKKQKRSGKKR